MPDMMTMRAIRKASRENSYTHWFAREDQPHIRMRVESPVYWAGDNHRTWVETTRAVDSMTGKPFRLWHVAVLTLDPYDIRYAGASGWNGPAHWLTREGAMTQLHETTDVLVQKAAAADLEEMFNAPHR